MRALFNQTMKLKTRAAKRAAASVISTTSASSGISSSSKSGPSSGSGFGFGFDLEELSTADDVCLGMTDASLDRLSERGGVSSAYLINHYINLASKNCLPIFVMTHSSKASRGQQQYGVSVAAARSNTAAGSPASPHSSSGSSPSWSPTPSSSSAAPASATASPGSGFINGTVSLLSPTEGSPCNDPPPERLKKAILVLDDHSLIVATDTGGNLGDGRKTTLLLSLLSPSTLLFLSYIYILTNFYTFYFWSIAKILFAHYFTSCFLKK